MAVQISQILTEVQDLLLEPGTLTCGWVTNATFVAFVNSVAIDFLQRTGIAKKLVCLPIVSGTSQYSEYDFQMDTQVAQCAARYLEKTSAFYLDSLTVTWLDDSDVPRVWHEDRLNLKTIELHPKPNFNGNTVASSGNYYGTLSATSGATVFDFDAGSAFYGTASAWSGSPYLEVSGPLYGTISALAGSSGNLMMVSTVQPFWTATTTSDLLELIPASFTPAIKWGVMEKIHAMDGEAHDSQKAIYAHARYMEAVNLAKSIMREEILEEVK